MTLNEILRMCRDLNLKGAAECLARLGESEPDFMVTMPADVIIGTMPAEENNSRSGRRRDSLLRMSRLPMGTFTPGDIIYDDVRGREFRTLMEELLTPDFVKKGQNLCIFGCAGTGKTWIGTLPGRLNCAAGHSTVYFTTPALVDLPAMSRGSPLYASKLRTIVSRTLLILDDFCLTSFDEKQQGILFDVLNLRHGTRSTVILSRKTPEKWRETLGGTSLAESIVDRASTGNRTLTLQGKSRRRSIDPLPDSLQAKMTAVNEITREDNALSELK